MHYSQGGESDLIERFHFHKQLFKEFLLLLQIQFTTLLQ